MFLRKQNLVTTEPQRISKERLCAIAVRRIKRHSGCFEQQNQGESARKGSVLLQRKSRYLKELKDIPVVKEQNHEEYPESNYIN